MDPSKFRERSRVFFYPKFYLAEYLDVYSSKMDPFDHFVHGGAKERRDPNPFFDANFYVQQNPEVGQLGVAPFEHFLEFGLERNAYPSADFDPIFYAAHYPDVKMSTLAPYEHFVTIGFPEGRKGVAKTRFEFCKICRARAQKFFSKTLLQKYPVDYYRCHSCGFLQTENPYWLKEAYASPMSAMDTGVIRRPLDCSKVTVNLILSDLGMNPEGRFLDYGGGYGVFTRLMRDAGFDFYQLDKYAQNLFAPGFSIEDLKEGDRKFELVTGFELLEHLDDPMAALKEMFGYSKNALFSTDLQYSNVPDEASNWWYLGELHGQHISFFSERSLQIIAETFGCYTYTHNGFHLFTPKRISDFSSYSNFRNSKGFKARRKISDFFGEGLYSRPGPDGPESLTESDAELVIQALTEKA